MRKIYNYEKYIKFILEIEKQDISVKDIEDISEKKNESYKRFDIEKKGGTREIYAIDNSSVLYKIQKKLYINFLDKIPLPVPVIGFKKNNGYNDFLIKHINKKFYLRLDIKDFFGSISEKQIRDALSEFVLEEKIIDSIIDACMYNNKVPQGAITSPAISNIIFRRIDQRILKYCQSIQKVKKLDEDIIYTRYADDLLFSSNYFNFKNDKRFIKMIKRILFENGFSLNMSKTLFGDGQLSLSGFVIDGDLHLSQKKISNINLILHYFDKRDSYNNMEYCIDKEKIMNPKVLEKINSFKLNDSKGNEKNFSTILSFRNYLCGYRSFLISFLKVNNIETDNIKILRKKIKKIEILINEFNSLIEKKEE